MSEEVYNILLENTSDVEQEYADNAYMDDKLLVDKGAFNISDIELKSYTVNNIKTELPSFEISSIGISDSVKIEESSSADDMEIVLDKKLSFCDHCQVHYEDYCTECGMLVHILNSNTLSDQDTRMKGLPKDILEIRELFEQFGIFTLKVIPQGVTFGPFVEIGTTECRWKLQEGKLVVSNENLKFFNWTQYINRARNIFEQNLFALQCGNNLYYRSNRKIHEGEELLVFFGSDSLNAHAEEDFMPISKEVAEDVFACTFCCLGFSTREYLTRHKMICINKTNEKLLIEELAQCQFCKMYMNKEEYLECHQTNCCTINTRDCISPFLNNQVSERHQHHTYECKQCNYETTCKNDFGSHTTQHHDVKAFPFHLKNALIEGQESEIRNCLADKNMKIEQSKVDDYYSQDEMKQFKCLICDLQTKNRHDIIEHVCTKHLKRFTYECKTCEYKTNRADRLRTHMRTKHLNEFNFKCDICEYKTNWKENLKKHVRTRHLNEFTFKCVSCEFKTIYTVDFDRHMKTKHLKEFKYKCDLCEFQTNITTNLKNHVKTKHLKEFSLKCTSCEYKTNLKHNLEKHMNTIHLKEYKYKCELCNYQTNQTTHFRVHVRAKHFNEFIFKCTSCEFKTNQKGNLEVHIRTKHLKEFRYVCSSCEFKTNHKGNLEIHIKTKHLKEFSFDCAICEFKTNQKANLQKHMKTKHLKEFTYKCESCEFKTNQATHLKVHIKSKHLKEFTFKCDSCEFKTNHKTNLEQHVKTIHLKEYKYQCELCDFKTNQMTHLKRHVKSKHLKEFNFMCAMCEFKTNLKGNLEKHIKVKHHNKTIINENRRAFKN